MAIKTKDFQSLMAEAVKPDTTQKRRYEIGAAVTEKCGDAKVREAIDFCRRARVDIGIKDIGFGFAFYPEGFTITELREGAGLTKL